MILTDAQQAAAQGIQHEVRIAHRPFERDGFGNPARPIPVESLVGVVREVDEAIRDQISAAAILVRPRPHIVRGRDGIGRLTVR